MSRADDIVSQILSSERYEQSQVFSQRVYRDEPILRTGADAFGHAHNRAGNTERASSRPRRASMPKEYREMRSIARTHRGWASSYSGGGSRLFYMQGKHMEDFEDDYDGESKLAQYYPTYNEMSDHDLRCYFTWRTKLRAGLTPEAPTSFLYVHAYELLCGIGVEPGEEGYAEFVRFWHQYEDATPSFRVLPSRWSHDYVIYHGLDRSLLGQEESTPLIQGVVLLQEAQRVLLASTGGLWPETGEEGLPDEGDVLDALCSLSRYRAERSRYVKGHRDDVAAVCARVFGRMVEHCHKRRKKDYMEGLFGGPSKRVYTMFPNAIFWAVERHPDTTYEVGPTERYLCTNGFWWYETPCTRVETSRELGNLMHAIDCRMRIATGDKHPLKERTLPKYQGKFVDEEIDALLKRKADEEAARIRIDWSELGSIRSASVRTREALLTDEEREDEEVHVASDSPITTVKTSVAGQAPRAYDEPSMPVGVPAVVESAVPLTDEQLALLQSLLAGEAPPAATPFLSLVVDAINEAFLDVVGDTVIEFDGDVPVLVEDYEQDVRDALG